MGTKIEWCDITKNVVSGCSKVSEGCQNCFAEKFAKRLQAMGCRGYENGFQPTMHPWVLDEIEKLKKPKKIFLNSMGDLFHQDIPDRYINQVWNTIFNHPKHRYIILTKRSGELLKWTHVKSDYCHWPMEDIWPDWIWLGVSVESQKHLSRIYDLLKTRAAVKVISFEPLLGPIVIPEEMLRQLSWVIVGAEQSQSVKGLRVMNPAWAYDIWKQCQDAGVPYFFKKWNLSLPEFYPIKDLRERYEKVESTRQFPEVKA